MFQSTITNFNINFNALNESKIISSGDQLTGHISFDLTKETKITSITMKVTGKANVHWSSGSGKNRRNFSAKLDFFNIKSVIVQETNGLCSLRPVGCVGNIVANNHCAVKSLSLSSACSCW